MQRCKVLLPRRHFALTRGPCAACKSFPGVRPLVTRTRENTAGLRQQQCRQNSDPPCLFPVHSYHIGRNAAVCGIFLKTQDASAPPSALV
jgi:hypothetical protein